MMPLTQPREDNPLSHQQAAMDPSPPRIVPKPIPETLKLDPRTYETSQIKRRFNPKVKPAQDGSTSYIFNIIPSDPDFPYELAQLECELKVPKKYPNEKPALKVRNSDIPRGFGINIERGWDKLVEDRRGATTLLALTKALDKNLETFLSEQKVDTVKLMSFKDTRHLDSQPASSSRQQPPAPYEAPTPKPSSAPLKPYIPEESYTRDQIAEAKARRAQDIRQLEARMGRLPNYRRSADGVVYTLPLEPRRRQELPPGLRSVSTIHLIVPLLYPLQDLRVQLNEADAEDAEPVEDIFVEKAAAQKSMTLMSQINYLAQNLHALAKQAQLNKDKIKAEVAAAAAAADADEEAKKNKEIAHDGAETPGKIIYGGKGHVQVIPRPPEWDFVGSDEEWEDSDSGEDSGGVVLSYDEDSSSDEKGQQQPSSSAAADTPERGTMITLPSVELLNVELIQISRLSISVRCERCRTPNEITSLLPNVPKTTSCKKCATPFSATFRPQLVHANSTRAGFIDLTGAKVTDMLPSTFVPTCARCSTASSAGIVSVRGESMTNVCRECHAKFTFKIPDIKFMLLTPETHLPPTMGPRRRDEKLGIHAGDALPKNGTCVHYRKSYRWFRFSCCNKVHPCDKCHDETEADHINEWANRMICGWCSREQNYAVEACGFCGRSVIGKKGKGFWEGGKGFWEGGKGTRDRTMMNRKDRRKYKRLEAAKK